MVAQGAIAMHGTRGGAYYTLPQAAAKSRPSTPSDGPASEERVLALVAELGSICRKDVVETLGIEPGKATTLLRKLRRRGQLLQRGEKSSARYSLPGHT